MHRAVVPLAEVGRFITDVMAALGVAKCQSQQLADVLVSADYRGHYSHGLNRLQYYINDITTGACDPHGQPFVVQQSSATALVDGANTLGPVVGNFCTLLAIEKARQSGVGWVVARNSNHYGIAGWYSEQCARAGMIGLSFTNTSPVLVPTRGKQPVLGSNPISCAAPCSSSIDEPFSLDMATCTVAMGKVEIQKRRGEALPNNWATDNSGSPTTDPHQAVYLQPLGGDEISGGYKGYGLAFMVELFCGVMANTPYGANVRIWQNKNEKANLAQCFVAVDAENYFAPGLANRVNSLKQMCRNCPPSGDKPVLVAGDPEQEHRRIVDKQGGILYIESQMKEALKIADTFGVRPLQTILSQ